MKRLVILIALATAVVGGWYAYSYYQKIYTENVLVNRDVESAIVHIPTGSTLEDVINILTVKEIIEDSASFAWTAQLMEYHDLVRPGRYRVKKGMNNRELITMLRAGIQEPFRIRLTEYNSLQGIAGFFGNELEADSAEFMELLNDERFLDSLGFNQYTILSLFLPDTYEFYWNRTSREVINRMKREYDSFWTDSRREKAASLGFDPTEVSTLASIVQAETYQTEEMPRIAGVYLNRLDRGMRLEADPTVLFALDDPTIQRVLRHHLDVVSPYNTYRNHGLPPGPIRLPGTNAINAVLNAEEHDYLYFCAKADFTGFHNFSRTYREHLRCAREYHRALNRLGY